MTRVSLEKNGVYVTVERWENQEKLTIGAHSHRVEMVFHRGNDEPHMREVLYLIKKIAETIDI